MKLEINDFNELVKFIDLFRHLDDERLKSFTTELNKDSDKLIQAEQKDGKHVSTSSS